MGLASHIELKEAVARRLGRSGDADLEAELDDYIDLAEARFQRELRLRAQEQRATAVLSSAYLDLPTDFLELRNIQLDTDPVRSLECVSPEIIDRSYPQTAPARPQVYAILGSALQFAPPPDRSYTVEIDYWKRFEALSDAAPSNRLLVNAPDVYLFAVLAEAAQATGDSARWQEYEARLAAALDKLKVFDRRASYSGATLRVRPRVVV
ncbi:hypothetical protein FRZ61_37240 [Hypericibacter adhaerens]|uniref:Uncharacterized protein n=1 Tax=Hypericibacter adhaerens TaxID=2602016 RepID=A0A5J6N4D7_9PROT|nr:hypothetical protein [Hypericibacter adhaerens]QEX23785.1 hypothetical protein FRZ61_37240 [Hypericibacter adhaerens]